MCLTCGCMDAHLEMGERNITYEDIKRAADENGQWVARRSTSLSARRGRTQSRTRRSTRRPDARHGGMVAEDQDWPFDQPPDAAAISVRAVLDGAPILLVSHDADDEGWQFLDGNEVDLDQAVLISMARAVGLDPSLREVADMLPG